MCQACFVQTAPLLTVLLGAGHDVPGKELSKKAVSDVRAETRGLRSFLWRWG